MQHTKQPGCHDTLGPRRGANTPISPADIQLSHCKSKGEKKGLGYCFRFNLLPRMLAYSSVDEPFHVPKLRVSFAMRIFAAPSAPRQSVNDSNEPASNWIRICVYYW